MTHPPPTPQADDSRTRPAGEPPPLALALGRIPSGLFILTWRDGDQDRGMLASWVMQAGFEPAMVTVAVAPGRDLLASIEVGRPFVINVLAENQRSLLAKFGKPAAAGEDPFAGLTVSRAGCGAPALADAAAWLECAAVSQTAGSDASPGDHIVVLARVIAAGTGSDQPPLVHMRKNGLRY